jgi:hypothetical protein
MAQDPGQDDGVAIDANSVISVDQSATVQTLYTGNTVTPSQDFAFPWNGVTVNFFSGESTVCAPDLMAALIAQSAPVTTP